jgi:hypothetical protein
MAQRVAFATGVPPDLYAFHHYTRNSTRLYHPLVRQYPTTSPGLAESFHARLNEPPTRPLRPVTPDNVCLLRFTAAAGT